MSQAKKTYGPLPININLAPAQVENSICLFLEGLLYFFRDAWMGIFASREAWMRIYLFRDSWICIFSVLGKLVFDFFVIREICIYLRVIREPTTFAGIVFFYFLDIIKSGKLHPCVAALEVRTCEFEGVSTRSKRWPLLFTGITLFPR